MLLLRESYTKLFLASHLKKKKSLIILGQAEISIPITLIGLDWRGKISHGSEVMIQELTF